MVFYPVLWVCQLYTCRCLWSFSSAMQSAWILPCGGSALATPYTSTPPRRRRKTRVGMWRKLGERQRRFTAAIPHRCPLGRSHKASVFFGSSIRRLWEGQWTTGRFWQRKVGAGVSVEVLIHPSHRYPKLHLCVLPDLFGRFLWRRLACSPEGCSSSKLAGAELEKTAPVCCW